MSDRERDENMVVRVPAELREILARQAAASERTLSGQVRWMLATAIEAQAKQQQTGRAA
jgi:hypothetical protein